MSDKKSSDSRKRPSKDSSIADSLTTSLKQRRDPSPPQHVYSSQQPTTPAMYPPPPHRHPHYPMPYRSSPPHHFPPPAYGHPRHMMEGYGQHPPLSGMHLDPRRLPPHITPDSHHRMLASDFASPPSTMRRRGPSSSSTLSPSKRSARPGTFERSCMFPLCFQTILCYCPVGCDVPCDRGLNFLASFFAAFRQFSCLSKGH